MSWPLFGPPIHIVEPKVDACLRRDATGIISLSRDTETALPLRQFAAASNSRYGPHASSFTALYGIMKPLGPYPLYHHASATGCDLYRTESNQQARVMGSEDGDGLSHSGPGQATALSVEAISSKTDVAPAQQRHLPFPCSVCKKRFRRGNDLARHSRIHTRRERDLYSCNWCSKKLTRSDTLTRHIKRLHTRNSSCTGSRRASRSSAHDKENVVQGRVDRRSGPDAVDIGYGMPVAAPPFDEHNDHHKARDGLYERLLVEALELE